MLFQPQWNKIMNYDTKYTRFWKVNCTLLSDDWITKEANYKNCMRMRI